ncbi:hypothetical protein GCM10025883_01780 [Mobilicoccus caccae]|uniref:Uncharacterized protein n=1 Tax=Mobilicoccus caccae TaxID=1859295 RepID=A0ABQ6IN44_9MICO|nr:hypothetical protein GCM10025883_01780 [Mobilicoccus caccae]
MTSATTPEVGVSRAGLSSSATAQIARHDNIATNPPVTAAMNVAIAPRPAATGIPARTAPVATQAAIHDANRASPTPRPVTSETTRAAKR